MTHVHRTEACMIIPDQKRGRAWITDLHSQKIHQPPQPELKSHDAILGCNRPVCYGSDLEDIYDKRWAAGNTRTSAALNIWRPQEINLNYFYG